MTRLDPSPHRASNSSLMDERRGRDRSRQPSESRGDRQQESGYFSPDRKSVGEQQTEDVKKRPHRHYERGHALPYNHVPDPKACVPYRTVNLGVPSQRRTADTFLQESWRSESPQRYSYHSNFRRSQENSPTRHYSKSPDRKVTVSPPASQRRSSHSRSRPMSQAPSHVPSHTPSRHTSGRSSPSHRRGSVLSRPASPSRASPYHKRTDSSHLDNGTLNGRSRESRCPSQASNGHSLDSEKLYKNLESISRRGSSTAIQLNSYQGSQASPRTRNSHHVSPSRSGHGSTHNHSPQREPRSRDSRPDTTQTYSERNSEREPRSRDSRPDTTQTYSDRNSEREPRSRDSRPDTTQTYLDRNSEREPRSRDSRPDTTQTYSDRNSEREPRSRDSRPDTTPQTYSDRNSEREPRSRDSRPDTTQQTYSDRNSEREPRSRDSRPDTTQTYSERNSEREPRSRDSRPDTTPQTYSDRNSEREPRSRDSRPDTTPQTYSDRNSEREPRSRDSRPDTTQQTYSREERISPAQGSWHGSSHSLLSPTHSHHGSSPSRRAVDSERLAHSLHSHAAPGATDQVNNSNNTASSDRSRSNMARGMGALLTSEPKKSEVAAEEVAMTIDDYIEIADIPKLNMDSEEELQGLRRRTQSPSPRRAQGPRTPRCQDETYMSSSRVESDERGRGRERGRDRREKHRDSDDGMSRRQSTTSLHSQGSDKSGKHRSTRGKERGLPEDSLTALSLRLQVESIKKDRVAMGIEVDSPCGPGAPCRAKLEAMVSAHHKTLEELQEKHARELRELEREKDRLLQEESEAATKAMEALKQLHREEMTSRTEVGGPHMDKTYRGQRPLQADSLHGELDVLSEHYSQRCQALNVTEQSGRRKEMELGSKQREMDQLCKENQDLRAKLAEEISRMRLLVTGQKSDLPALGSAACSASDTEVQLRAKEKEVEYLQKEISCLRSEVQSLIKEKEAAYERYKTAYVELNEVKGRSQLETSSLKEHLRLANAALQEGTRDT